MGKPALIILHGNGQCQGISIAAHPIPLDLFSCWMLAARLPTSQREKKSEKGMIPAWTKFKQQINKTEIPVSL